MNEPDGMNVGGGANEAGTNEQGAELTFNATFEADTLHVVEMELAAWMSSCSCSVTSEQDPNDKSITLTLQGKESDVLARARELLNIKESVQECIVDLDTAVIIILSKSSNMDQIQAELEGMGLEVITYITSDGKFSITCLQDKMAQVS